VVAACNRLAGLGSLRYCTSCTSCTPWCRPAALFPCVLVATDDDTSCVHCLIRRVSIACRLLFRTLQLQLSSTTIRVQDLKVLQSTGLLSAVQAWCGPGKAARRRYLLDSARACCLRRGVRLVVAYLFCCVVAYISCCAHALLISYPPHLCCCTVLYCSILCACWWAARQTFQESVGDKDVSYREESKGKGGGKDEDRAAKHVAILARHLTNNWREMLLATSAGAGDARVHVLSPALQPLIQPEQQQKTIVDDEEEADQHAVAATTNVSTIGASDSSPDIEDSIATAKNPGSTGGQGRPEASITLAPRTPDAAVGDARAELLAPKPLAAGVGGAGGMADGGESSKVTSGSGSPKIGVTFTHLRGREKQGYFAVKSLVAQGILPLSVCLSLTHTFSLPLYLSGSTSTSMYISLYLYLPLSLSLSRSLSPPALPPSLS